MTRFKLGSKFWVREQRSDFECKIVARKICEFIDGDKFVELHVERTRLNSYHESFASKASRTNLYTYKYRTRDRKWIEWIDQNWPAPCSRWEECKDSKFFFKKPKNLRRGP